MDIYNLSTELEFEWDGGNSTKNYSKHGVTSSEIEECFFNFTLVSPDIIHSQNEERFNLLGETDSEKILFISFTIRFLKIRVISARSVDKKEKQTYETAKNHS
ncbi:BrnT family toxin [Candidatus Amesbacteria bacterium]|nr:BrnT family toxin [Candidatus Amesbacteria bacterium]